MTQGHEQEIIRLVLTRPTWHLATNTIELMPETTVDSAIIVDVGKLLSVEDLEDIFSFVQDKLKQSLRVGKRGGCVASKPLAS